MTKQTNLIVRTFRETDQESVKTLVQAGLSEYFGFIDHALNPDLNDIQKTYIENGDAFLLAEKEGVLVGTGGLVSLDEQAAQIVRVSVHKGHRREGIAQAIIKHLLQIAKDKGFSDVIVETTKIWHKPIALYQKLGFREYQQTENDIYLKFTL